LQEQYSRVLHEINSLEWSLKSCLDLQSALALELERAYKICLKTNTSMKDTVAIPQEISEQEMDE